MKISAASIKTNLSESDYQFFLSLVHEEKKRRILKFRFQQDALRSLTGELLLRYQLKTLYGIDNYEIDIGINGKPLLRDQPNIYFNISHSGDWAVCVVGDCENGIDIECVSNGKSLTDMRSIEQYYMADDEIRNVRNLQKNQMLEEYVHYWTMKEAFVKCVGGGISMLKSNKYSLCGNQTLEYNNIRYFFKELAFPKDYKLAICMRKHILNPDIEYFNTEQFKESFQ